MATVTKNTKTDDEPIKVGEPSEDRIDAAAAVALAEDPKVDPAVRQRAYEATLEYFLDDENDIIENPILFPIDIVRETELENGDTAEKIAFSCEIRTLSDVEIKQVQRRSREKQKGPGGVTLAEESDDARFHTMLAVEAITQPNIYDPRLMSKHNKPETLLQHYMLPGERISLGFQILKLSGFGNSARSALSLVTEDVETAKD